MVAKCNLSIGNIYARIKKYDVARTYYEQAKTSYSEIGDLAGEANCIKLVGELHGELGNLCDSIAYILKGAFIFHNIGLLADEAASYNAIGIIYYLNGKFDMALMEYDKAIAMYPEDVRLYRSRAQVLLRINRIEDAKADINTATRLQPASPDLLHLKGLLALHEHQPEQAVSSSRSAVQRIPKNNHFHATLAFSLLVAEQPSEATTAFSTALSLTYRHWDARIFSDDIDQIEHLYGPLKSLSSLREQLDEWMQHFHVEKSVAPSESPSTLTGADCERLAAMEDCLDGNLP